MIDAVGTLNMFLVALSPIFTLTVVLSLALSISHGVVNIYKNI